MTREEREKTLYIYYHHNINQTIKTNICDLFLIFAMKNEANTLINTYIDILHIYQHHIDIYSKKKGYSYIYGDDDAKRAYIYSILALLDKI